MIKVLTSDQMRAIDYKAITELNIPSIILMENAGIAVSTQIIKIISQYDIKNPKILVICGKGNNAGDGYVVARQLAQEDFNIQVISLYDEYELSGDGLINHNIAKHFTDIKYINEFGTDSFQIHISQADIIIDAIFGTGLNSPIKGQIINIIDSVNKYSEGIIVSIDIPSGIDASTGKVMESAIVADYTVTFFAPKLGNILYPGADYSGEVIISDISIPFYLENDNLHNINLIDRDFIREILPFRSDNSNKGTFGSVFNIAGSKKYIGAAGLCSKASLATGAGYSMLAAPQSIISTIAANQADIIFFPLKETKNGNISSESLSFVLDASSNCNVYLIGPGIGTNESTIKFVEEFTQQITDRGLTAVFDADALNCFSEMDNFTLPINSILTPHPAELARLMKVSIEEILNDRILSARMAALKLNTIVVLKGARTIIAEPDGTVYINPTGNSSLAKAGTGDVLAGMIAGFAAQGCNTLDAAMLGVYLHGLAADIAVNDLTEYSLTASKLLDYIPIALKKACGYSD